MISMAENSYSRDRLKRYKKFYPFLGLVARPASYDRFLANGMAILDFDSRNDLGNITCPTLVLGGEEDMVLGIQGSYDLRDLIEGSELHTFRGLGHAAFEESPDFSRLVFEFLDKAE